jgi:hypothetical protein
VEEFKTINFTFELYCTEREIYRLLQKQLYNGIPNVTVRGDERWIVCTPFSVNVFVTLATQ